MNNHLSIVFAYPDLTVVLVCAMFDAALHSDL